MNVKVPDWYKPMDIPYRQVGPNKWVRTGPMPGTAQAVFNQGVKNLMDEGFGQIVSEVVSDVYDQHKVYNKQKK